jgi:hypothetical protein
MLKSFFVPKAGIEHTFALLGMQADTPYGTRPAYAETASAGRF